MVIFLRNRRKKKRNTPALELVFNWHARMTTNDARLTVSFIF